ncbi:MAG TPA: tetratricopeptide repeat protein, partial [Stellaceae bacterium]|nr:tetratricopeptide repeat protein [Stellaceae bacterium]
MAEAHLARGSYERAYRTFLRVLASTPGDLSALVDCGTAAEKAAEQARSESTRQRWLRAAAEQFTRVGELHAQVRSGTRAETAFRHALELDPNAGVAAGAYADLLAGMGRLSEAEPLYRRALAQRPDSTLLLNNLATALADLGREDEAEPLFRRVLELEPYAGEAEYALTSGRLMRSCYRSDVSAESLFEAHRSWGAALVSKLTEVEQPFPNPREPERRLKIGYVSPDFRQHSIVHFF